MSTLAPAGSASAGSAPTGSAHTSSAPTGLAPAGESSILRAGVVPTPAGPLGVVVQDDGVVRAAGFGDLDGVVARLLLQDPTADVRPAASRALPGSVREAVERYGAGDVGALDLVPVRQAGGPFQQAAWDAMRRIAPGTTATYSALAAAAGRPSAVRAAGSACARNLVAPFVPCHRVVRTDGTLGGYAYGLATKQALLAFERGQVEPHRP